MNDEKNTPHATQPSSAPDGASRNSSSSDGAPSDGHAAAEAVLATSKDGQTDTIRENSDLMQNLFEALDDVAKVVVALKDDPDHGEKAQTLDVAGKRIIDSLVREFSFKSAQVEVLLRELDDVDEAWGDYAYKVAYRNEQIQGGSEGARA